MYVLLSFFKTVLHILHINFSKLNSAVYNSYTNLIIAFIFQGGAEPIAGKLDEDIVATLSHEATILDADGHKGIDGICNV